MRLRSAAMGISLVFLGGCFSPSCNFRGECQNDYDCADDEICEYPGSLGGCEPVTLCSEGCVDGETCVQRPSVAPENPFESAKPGKQVCECPSSFGCYDEPGGSGGSAGSGGSGGGTGGAPLCDLPGPAGEIMDLRPIGGAASETLVRVTTDASAIAVAFEGTLADPAMTSSGDTDVMVAGTSGGLASFAWTRQLGNESANVPTALASWDANVAVATSFKGAIETGLGPLDAGPGTGALVASLSAEDGSTVWAHVLRSNGDVAITAVAGGDTGTLIVAGTFSGDLDLGGATLSAADELDAFVAGIETATSQAVWSHVLGGPGDQDITALAGDSNGGFFLSGSFDAELFFDGASVAAADGQDSFVMRLTNDGAVAWNQIIGGPDGQIVTALSVTPALGVAAAGARASASPASGYVAVHDEAAVLPAVGLVDGFVVQYEPDGGFAWARLFSGPAGSGFVSPRGLAVDCAGNVLLAGATGDLSKFGAYTLMSQGEQDGFVHKMKSNGGPLWTVALGGAAGDAVSGIGVRGDGSSVAAGSFAGELTSPSPGPTSAGAEDALFVEVSP